MKYKSTFYLFCTLSTVISAQSGMSVSGGYINREIGSVSYTVGQVFYCTNINNNSCVIPGVQQPYTITIVSELSKNVENVECSVYPNPTNNYLRLNIKNYKTENLLYRIFDNKGIELLHSQIDNLETIISFQNFISAVYFIKVTEFNKTITVFKVIKNR